MRFVGIDIASEVHVAAVLDEDARVLVRPTSFGEDAGGYAKLRELLGPPGDVLVAMEATGHYWQNLFAFLVGEGFAVALLNPLRTRRFAGEDLERTKTDAIDALGIARFAAQKRPAVTRLADEATRDLRELVRLRVRLRQDFDARVHQLHRLVDLGFPEFTRHVHTLSSELATAILCNFPTAAAFHGLPVRRLARVRYDGRHAVGEPLARDLIEAARSSVGQHHGQAYQVSVRYACEAIELLRRQLRELERDIETRLRQHEVGKLLTTIDGIGTQTAARLVGELGDPSEFRSAAALVSYLGLAPGRRDSGKRQGRHAPLCRIGHAALRKALWMPTLTAVRTNVWLKTYYEGLRARGKPTRVALVATMRKLVSVVYAVARERRPFVPELGRRGVTA
jgi:transposase